MMLQTINHSSLNIQEILFPQKKNFKKKCKEYYKWTELTFRKRNMQALMIQVRLIFLFFLNASESVPRVNERKFFEIILEEENWETIESPIMNSRKKLTPRKFYQDIYEPLVFNYLSKPHTDLFLDYISIPCLNFNLFNKLSIETDTLSFSKIKNVIIIKKNDKIVNQTHPLLKLLEFCKSLKWSFNKELGSINPEIISSIFESFVNQKELGTYYTPKYITDYLVENAILNYISIKTNCTIASLSDIYQEKVLSYLLDKNGFSTIKIIDPAVGSGAFLISAFNFIEKIMIKAYETVQKPFNLTKIRLDILTKKLFGTDIDECAIEICKLNLWLHLLGKEKKISHFPNIQRNLINGNSIIGYTNIKNIKSRKQLVIDNNLTKLGNITNLFRKSSDPIKSLQIYENICSLNNQLHIKVVKLFCEHTDILRNDLIKQIHWFVEFPDNTEFNLIIGNPPYIRQEMIVAKKEIRQSIKMNHQKVYHNSQADIYAYFLENLTSICQLGGVVAFVLPSKWLSVGYGIKTKEFLCKFYKINSITNFGYSIFQGIEIDVMLVVLQRKQNNNDNKTNFYYFEQPQDFQLFSSNTKNLIRKMSVKTLSLKSNWSLMNFRITNHKKIMSHKKMKPLRELVELKNGAGVNKTGCVKFFYPSQEFITKYKIPSKFLYSCAKGPKIIKNYLSSEKNNKESNKILIIPRETNIIEEKIDPYIKYGMNDDFDAPKKPPHLRRSCQNSNRPWYSVKLSKSPHFFLPILHDKVFRVIENDDRIYSSDNLIYCNLRDNPFEINLKIILACLNSTIGQYYAENLGRAEGAGALHVKKFEADEIPVLDPKQLTMNEKKQLINLYEDLIKLAYKSNEAFRKRNEMTQVILSIIEFAEDYNEICQETEKIIKKRIGKTDYR
jgi:hypothetical protein